MEVTNRLTPGAAQVTNALQLVQQMVVFVLDLKAFRRMELDLELVYRLAIRSCDRPGRVDSAVVRLIPGVAISNLDEAVALEVLVTLEHTIRVLLGGKGQRVAVEVVGGVRGFLCCLLRLP